MQENIISYFLLYKECYLRGIGTLKLIHNPAILDVQNNMLRPPRQQIIFDNTKHSDNKNLLQYLADKLSVSKEEAKNKFDEFCKNWKAKITEGGKIELHTLGTFEKNENGEIVFRENRNTNYFQPIVVENHYPDSVLSNIELSEESKSTKNNLLENIVVEKTNWRLWALILFALGGAFFFFYYKDHQLSINSSGNQNHLIIDSAKNTYVIPDR